MFPSVVESVEWLLPAWGLLLTVWAVWTLWLLRRPRWTRLAAVVRGEAGLSYSLGFVMTVPLYLLLCLTIVESAQLLSTKVATISAAYAGARSRAVWEAMRPELKEDRMNQSVVSALAPFVISGDDDSGPASSEVERHAQDYVDALELFRAEGPVKRELLKTHYQRVAARTRVEIRIPERRQGGDVVCVVEYRAPFLAPGVGRILDPDHQEPFEYRIRSTVTLTLEHPRSADGTLGIDYQSF